MPPYAVLMPEAVVDAVLPAPNDVARAVRAMWRRCAPRKRLNDRFVRQMDRLCVRLGTVEHARALADAEIDALVRSPAARRCLRALRRFLGGGAGPEVRDAWPAAVHRFLGREVAAAEDRTHLRRWMETVCNAHLLRHPDREPRRTRAWLSRHLVRIFRLADRARGTETTLAAFLPFHTDLEGLRDAFARILLAWCEQDRRRGVHGSHAVRVTLALVRSAIKSGVFPGIAPAAGGAFTLDALVPAMEAAARTEPGRWAAAFAAAHRPGNRTAAVRVPRTPISETEAERLLRHAEDAWDRALLTLLVTVAPRIGEICRLRVDQVWDATGSGSVRDRFAFVEKGSKLRTAWVRPPLREALDALLRGSPDAAPDRASGRYVFEVTEPRCGRPPSRTTLCYRLRRACARAGVRPLNPHMFRAFVVNFGLRRGCTLEQMAGFLNHRSPVTTSAYYWTDDVTQQVVDMLDGQEGETGDTIAAELCAVEAQIAALRGGRPCTRHGLAPPPATSSCASSTPMTRVGDGTEDVDMDALFERLATTDLP